MKEYNKIPYINLVLMNIGFRIILLLGILNSLIFNPKSAGKNYSKVSAFLFLSQCLFSISNFHVILIFQKFKGIFNKIEEIYIHYVYRRVSDCSHAPVSCISGVRISLQDRETTDHGWTHRFSDENRIFTTRAVPKVLPPIF